MTKRLRGAANFGSFLVPLRLAATDALLGVAVFRFDINY